MKIDMNLGILWAAIAGTAAVIMFMFNTFAKAEDVKELSYYIIKGEIREIRAALNAEEDEIIKGFLAADLQELVDKLCLIQPFDRECNGR